MSEKRFKVIKDFQPITFVDLVNGKHYDCEEVCGLLNEQQATIEKLERKLKDCEHEHFRDSLRSSNQWFGMGGF